MLSDRSIAARACLRQAADVVLYDALLAATDLTINSSNTFWSTSARFLM